MRICVRLHDFLVTVRPGIGGIGFPQGFLDLAGHPLIILRPQCLLHAQRSLPQQVQQAEQPHIVGSDDMLPNLGFKAQVHEIFGIGLLAIWLWLLYYAEWSSGRVEAPEFCEQMNNHFASTWQRGGLEIYPSLSVTKH